VPRPVAVAITGGIGAGKSSALAAFARHGAATSSSDAIVHRLLREDAHVRAAIAERWGEGVADDRARIAEIVFKDRAELDWLEALLHPAVRRDVDAWLDDLAASPEPPALAVAEIPLLYESRREGRFDHVLVLTAPPEIRDARSKVRRDDRGRRLIPDEEKVRRADYSYVNDGSLEQLEEWVARVVAELSSPGELASG
jgi:dephospho-CoA kinase